jgi:hypothetical protein
MNSYANDFHAVGCLPTFWKSVGECRRANPVAPAVNDQRLIREGVGLHPRL